MQTEEKCKSVAFGDFCHYERKKSYTEPSLKVWHAWEMLAWWSMLLGKDPLMGAHRFTSRRRAGDSSATQKHIGSEQVLCDASSNDQAKMWTAILNCILILPLRHLTEDNYWPRRNKPALKTDWNCSSAIWTNWDELRQDYCGSHHSCRGDKTEYRKELLADEHAIGRKLLSIHNL